VLADGGARDWRTSHLWQIQPIRDVLVLAAGVGLLWLGYRLSLVTVPLLLALALAYLFEPVVARVTRGGRVSRPGAAMAIIVLGAALVIVPVALGGAFAVVQGVRFAQAVATDVSLLQQSIDQPDDAGLRARLAERGEAWADVRDYVVEQQRRVEAQRKGTPSGADAAGGAEGGAAGDAAGDAASGATGAAAGSAGDANAAAVKPEPTVGPDSGNGAVEGAAASAGAAADAGDADGADAKANADASTETMSERLAGAVEALAPEDTYLAIQWAIRVVRSNAEAIGKQALQVGGGAVGAAVQTFGAAGKIAFAAFLTAFFFYFVCVGWPKVIAFGHELIPEARRGRTMSLVSQMDAVIAGFIRGRLTICAILIVYYIVGYWLIGVPAPFILGAVIGVLTLVPYAAGVGIFVSIGLLALSPYEGVRGEWWWVIGAPLVVHSLQQVLDDYVLTPRIQGKSTNMDTPTILFASIAGGVLAGFYGLLLAIPVAACIKILLREVVWPRFVLWSRGKAADPLPLGKP
jgi:predicted PurR-regulated permease PerM